MNEWTILPNKLINMSKLTGKNVIKIVYDQVFKVGDVRKLVSTLDVGFSTKKDCRCSTRYIYLTTCVIFLVANG